MEEFKSKAGLVSETLKSLLEEFNLYIAVDAKTKEFVFIDRDAYHNGGPAKIAKVSMEQINITK